MISYAPEEAELIESGALTNKTELLIIQCEVIQYNMKLKHYNIRITTHVHDKLFTKQLIRLNIYGKGT